MTTKQEAHERAAGYACGREDASGVKTVPAPGSHRGDSGGWMDFADAFAVAQDDFSNQRHWSMTNCKAAYECWTKSGGTTIFQAHESISPELISAARGWIADCEWADIAEDDIADLSDNAIRHGIARHYPGGWAAFEAAETG